MSLFLNNLQQHKALFETLDALDASVHQAIELIVQSLKNNKKLMICGNGGSAADSQHIAAEFTGRFIKDYSFDEVFSRQLRALGQAGDCL